jgi:hypothetical protein
MTLVTSIALTLGIFVLLASSIAKSVLFIYDILTQLIFCFCVPCPFLLNNDLTILSLIVTLFCSKQADINLHYPTYNKDSNHFRSP